MWCYVKKPSRKKADLKVKREKNQDLNDSIDITSFINSQSQSADERSSKLLQETDDISKENIISQMLEDASITNLSSAKANWYFGEWQALVDLDIQALSFHPEVAKFAALKAAGYQQLNEMEQSKVYFKLAKRLGCDNQLISQLLIAGVHNALGKVAALKKDDKKMLAHFTDAVSVGGNSQENKLARQARSVKETARLGLLPQSIQLLNDVSIQHNERPAETQEKFDLLKNALHEIKLVNENLNGKGLSKPFKINEYVATEKPIVIIVAGMRHSGSTALFNILRLALKKSGFDIISGYSEKFDMANLENKPDQVYLIKTHELRDDILNKATLIITSIRDLRDSVASAKRRKFAMLDNVGGAVEYAKYNRSIFEQWVGYSQYQFHYENFMSTPVNEIGKLLSVIGLSDIKPEDISQEVNTLPTDQYSLTLLSSTHITDPERKHDYHSTLAKEQIDLIEQQHGTWLKNNNYT